MDGFRETAFYLALWYAFLAALGAVLLIALNDVGAGHRLPDRRQLRCCSRSR